jgi:endogenous inhibitor of DNA gyrase (YacG/DUF329 family)
MELCLIADCDNELFSKGKCIKHYQREWRKRNADKVKRYNEARRLPVEDRACPTCGEEFTPANPIQLYCSRKCGDVQHKEAARRRGYKAPQTDARRDARHRRRARLNGGKTGRPVTLEEIARRDAGRCGICGEPVTNEKWPHPLTLNLDHIVPLAEGGIHDPTNVQLSHAVCNQRKGRNLPSELLQAA